MVCKKKIPSAELGATAGKELPPFSLLHSRQCAIASFVVQDMPPKKKKDQTPQQQLVSVIINQGTPASVTAEQNDTEQETKSKKSAKKKTEYTHL